MNTSYDRDVWLGSGCTGSASATVGIGHNILHQTILCTVEWKTLEMQHVPV